MTQLRVLKLIRKARLMAPLLLNWPATLPYCLGIQRDLDKLQGMMDRLSPAALGFQSPTSEQLTAASAAPVFYSCLHEEELLNLCIFSLHGPGAEIPLHNHPGMHGFLKVLQGQVRVTSYSFLTPPEEARLVGQLKDLRPVVPEGSRRLLTATDPAVFLSPLVRNLHRVQADGGVASFVDLLIPRYHPPKRGRQYFRVLDPRQSKNLSLDVGAISRDRLIWIREIPVPKSLWCDKHPIPPKPFQE